MPSRRPASMYVLPPLSSREMELPSELRFAERGESTAELRQLIADLVGYEIAQDGRTILSADRTPKKFAFMCEQPGQVLARRRCLLMCQLSKPTQELNTVQDTPEITQLDYPFTWRPVTIPSTDIRTSGYASFTGLADYATFFDAVNIELAHKTE